jgi:hypothetical protein
MSELRRAEERVLAAKLRINCSFPRSNDGGEGADEFRRAVRELVAAQERFWEIEAHQGLARPNVRGLSARNVATCQGLSWILNAVELSQPGRRALGVKGILRKAAEQGHRGGNCQGQDWDCGGLLRGFSHLAETM